jgi:hypothetical protein
VELRPLQKPIPPKPVGRKKGMRLRAFKFNPKPKPKDKPISKRDSCLGSEVVPGPIPRLEGAGLQASPFIGFLGASPEGGPVPAIMPGGFRYMGLLRLDRSCLSTPMPEMWAPIGLGPEAIAKLVLTSGFYNSRFSKMADSLMVEVVLVISAPPNVSLVFSLNPHPSLPFGKIAA